MGGCQSAPPRPSALYTAACDGEIDKVKKLLDACVDVDKGNPNDGTTPLNIACKGSDPAVVRLLLTADAAVNQADNHGFTPLMRMCMCSSWAYLVSELTS